MDPPSPDVVPAPSPKSAATAHVISPSHPFSPLNFYMPKKTRKSSGEFFFLKKKRAVEKKKEERRKRKERCKKEGKTCSLPSSLSREDLFGRRYLVSVREDPPLPLEAYRKRSTTPKQHAEINLPTLTKQN